MRKLLTNNVEIGFRLTFVGTVLIASATNLEENVYEKFVTDSVTKTSFLFKLNWMFFFTDSVIDLSFGWYEDHILAYAIIRI